LNENLEVGKHNFVLKTNLNAKAWDETANTIDITSVQLNNEGTPKNLNVKKLVAKAYPTISSKVSWDDLILTISNSNSNSDDISI
jgi:hypothetical protein